MYKIAFVIPYFVNGGGMPDYFPLWLKTAGWNKDVDFLVFSDADMKVYKIPNNVHVKEMNWNDLVELFQSKFSFKIALIAPYKLCDFKPAYGEIFGEYLKEYDFWGHCDIDLFFGRIRRFVTDDLLDQYDRIYTRGHCCLYRNVCTVNSWYRTMPNKEYQKWEDVYTTSRNCCFDEWAEHCGGGISLIIKANGIPVYDKFDFADLNVKKGRFYPNGKAYCNDKHIYFRVGSDGCFAYNDKGQLDEVIYVHFQKRKLAININKNAGVFYFCAPACVSCEPRTNWIKVKKYEVTALARRAYNKLKS